MYKKNETNRNTMADRKETTCFKRFRAFIAALKAQ